MTAKSKKLQAEYEALRVRPLQRYRTEQQEELRSLVARAQAAWEGDSNHVVLRFPSGRDHLVEITLGGFKEPLRARLAAEFENLDETIWNQGLAEIASIGWALHTWTIGGSNHQQPVPVFARPTGRPS